MLEVITKEDQEFLPIAEELIEKCYYQIRNSIPSSMDLIGIRLLRCETHASEIWELNFKNSADSKTITVEIKK